MDVKITFLNGDLYEDVYMAQPCRGRKRTYGMPPEEIHLWIKADILTVISKV